MQSELSLIGQIMDTFKSKDAAAVSAAATIDQTKVRAKFDQIEKADENFSSALEAILDDIQNYLALTLSGSS